MAFSGHGVTVGPLGRAPYMHSERNGSAAPAGPTAEELAILQLLNKELGKTIVMVTHDPHAAARAKRTLHLEKGVLVTEGVV